MTLLKQQYSIQNKVIAKIMTKYQAHNSERTQANDDIKRLVAELKTCVESYRAPFIRPMAPAAVLLDEMFDKPELPVRTVDAFESLNSDCLDPSTLRQLVSVAFYLSSRLCSNQHLFRRCDCTIATSHPPTSATKRSSVLCDIS